MEKRKTITGEDILWAMGALSFDYYIEPLRLYLQCWRDAERAQSAKRGQNSKEGGGGEQPIELAYDAAKGGGAPSGSARITDQASSDEANAAHSD